MSISYEVQLMAIAILLYLYDSTLLLYSNEGLLITGRKGKWQARFGDEGLHFMGRSICILNPFTPYRATFRLNWKFDAAPVTVEADSLFVPPAKIDHIGPFTLNAGIALYLLLPIGLFFHIGAPFLIATIAMLYLNIVIALILLYRRRRECKLSGKKFASLAFECVACPPFGVNLIRRLTLAQEIGEPFIHAAERLLSAPAWNEVRGKCVGLLEQALENESKDSPRAQSMATMVAHLKSESI